MDFFIFSDPFLHADVGGQLLQAAGRRDGRDRTSKELGKPRNVVQRCINTSKMEDRKEAIGSIMIFVLS